MKKLINLTLLFTFVLILVGTSFSQFEFDGKSIELIAPDQGGRCVTGFGENPTVKRLAGNTGSITVTDCNGGTIGTITDTLTQTIIRNPTTGYWCFKTSDPEVIVSYTVGSNSYTWNWLANTDEDGVYNVKDFGALGNGHTAGGSVNTSADDTQAIKNAITFVAAKFGGTLYFPKGVYRVSSTLVLPSGIIIKGTSGMSTLVSQTYYSGTFQRSNSTISLIGESKSLFRIGECIDHVKFENIALKGESNNDTVGVEAVGQYPRSSQRFSFNNVAFDAFDKGLYFHAADSTKLWQIDYVNVDHCVFNVNRTAGIHIDSFNSDWKVSSSFFYMGAEELTKGIYLRGDGLQVERATTLQLSNSFGGGIDYTDDFRGGTFIRSLHVGGLTVLNSASERSSESISYGKDFTTGVSWGSYSNTLTVINSTFGDPVNLYGRANYVSSGNSYGGKTVTSESGIRLYSTGDRFCLDVVSNYDPLAPCGRDSSGNPIPLNQAGFQGSGKIVFQSGQPFEKNYSTGQEIPIIPKVTSLPLQMGSYTLTEMTSSSFANIQPGSIVFCSDCQKNTSPCQTGGNGTIAVKSSVPQWDCK